jgi:hypothetical protein
VRAALLAVLLLQQDRAERFFERVEFVLPEPGSDAARRVLEVLTKREHWVAGFRAVEDKVAYFPGQLTVKVTFDWEGAEFAQAGVSGVEGRVRFNLKKLEEYQKKVDEAALKREELERQGRKLVYRVPPARFDRMIWHELTHVAQRGLPAPNWFIEGMAQWVSEDPNPLYGFAAAGKKVESIETPLAEPTDCYARGHAFWNWLADRGIADRAIREILIERRPLKRSLEIAADLSWESLTAAEQEWSAREIDKLRPR